MPSTKDIMKFIEEPTNCPSCDYTLEKVNEQLFCHNMACPARVSKKIEHFVKVLGIKGLGPKSLEKLNIQEVLELFYLNKDKTIQILGEKVALKVLEEIERSKVASLATVLESFSIPLIGGTASTKIAGIVNTIDDITVDKCKEVGLGEKATQNLINWINTDYLELRDFLPFTYKNTVSTHNNFKNVCITGKLKSFKKKSDAESLLSAAGFNLVDSVTKTTDYLVDESNSMSSKREKAIQYGIPIITDLNDLLKVNNINE